MAKVILFQKTELMQRLKETDYHAEKDSENQMFEEMSMAKALLKLAHIDHEKEYHLCRSVAGHLLKTVPEPEEMNVDLE